MNAPKLAPKDLTLDELRARAPTLARVVSNVGTWEDHINAMAELNKLLREAAGT